MKKMIALLIMIIGVASFNYTGVFAAAKSSSWAQEYISEANEFGILPSSLSSADLTDNITREAFCELAYNTISQVSSKKSIKVTYSKREAHFYDTENKSVAALFKMGIISGKTSTKFAPNDYITREEAASIIDRAVDYIGLTKFSNTKRFSDNKQISGWAYLSVESVCGMNIMSGMSDGTFNPKGNYTREQAITTMIRFISAVPTDSKEKIANNQYYLYNDYFFWIENSDGEVTFKLSSERYSGMKFYSDGNEIVIFAPLRNSIMTDAYSISSGKKLFSIPARVIGTYADKKIIVSKQTGDTTVYGVYDFDGNLVLPIEYAWDYLYSKGYVSSKTE